MIPPRILLSGNESFGQLFIGLARDQLRILKREMSFQGLNEGVREIKPQEGVVIRCLSSFSIDTINIYVQPVLPEAVQEDARKEKCLELLPPDFFVQVDTWVVGMRFVDLVTGEVEVVRLEPETHLCQEFILMTTDIHATQIRYHSPSAPRPPGTPETTEVAGSLLLYSWVLPTEVTPLMQRFELIGEKSFPTFGKDSPFEGEPPEGSAQTYCSAAVNIDTRRVYTVESGVVLRVYTFETGELEAIGEPHIFSALPADKGRYIVDKSGNFYYTSTLPWSTSNLPELCPETLVIYYDKLLVDGAAWDKIVRQMMFFGPGNGGSIDLMKSLTYNIETASENNEVRAIGVILGDYDKDKATDLKILKQAEDSWIQTGARISSWTHETRYGSIWETIEFARRTGGNNLASDAYYDVLLTEPIKVDGFAGNPSEEYTLISLNGSNVIDAYESTYLPDMDNEDYEGYPSAKPYWMSTLYSAFTGASRVMTLGATVCTKVVGLGTYRTWEGVQGSTDGEGTHNTEEYCGDQSVLDYLNHANLDINAFLDNTVAEVEEIDDWRDIHTVKTIPPQIVVYSPHFINEVYAVYGSFLAYDQETNIVFTGVHYSTAEDFIGGANSYKKWQICVRTPESNGYIDITTQIRTKIRDRFILEQLGLSEAAADEYFNDRLKMIYFYGGADKKCIPIL